MRLRALPLALALTCTAPLACSDDDEPSVAPVDGTWNYFEMGVENNTCPVAFGVLQPSTTFLLDYDGGDGFEIEQFDQMDIVCNLVGGPDFVCPDRLVASEENTDLNIRVDFYVRLEGSFENDAEASGTQEVSIECVGDGCGALDELPCRYELPFRAEAQ
jgi:hypothetical protein